MRLSRTNHVILAVLIVVAAVSGVAQQAPAATDPVLKASIKCRAAIGKQMGSLVKTALKLVDSCHARRDKGKFVGECNELTLASADPKGKFAAAAVKADAAIAKACTCPGEQVCQNYPDPNDVDAALVAAVRDAIESSAAALQGSPDLVSDKARIKCHGAIGKARSAIVNEIVKFSTKCQKALDKIALDFGALTVPNCVGTPLNGGPKALAALTKACVDQNVVGAQVESCEPLPACLVPAATMTGQTLAAETYGQDCGNAMLEGDEECDDGNGSNDDACLDTCVAARCGDGFVHEGVEECDQVSNGCIQCQIVFTCGNGVIEIPGEQCDDGNSVATDACTDTCQNARCGDGIVRAGVEQCDDGNDSSNDACPQCQNAVCGDGFVRTGVEQCDDGNAVGGDGCTNCTLDPAVCGNGMLETSAETCDDGNTMNGDACPSNCRIEPCTPAGQMRDLQLSFGGSTEVAGLVLFLEYPDGTVSIPGIGNANTVQNRILNKPPNTTGNDLDYALRIGTFSSEALTPGNYVLVRFDTCQGAPPPQAGQFSCSVEDTTDVNGFPVAGVTCAALLQ